MKLTLLNKVAHYHEGIKTVTHYSFTWQAEEQYGNCINHIYTED